MEKVNRNVGHTSGQDGSSHLGLAPGGDLFQPPVKGATEALHLDRAGLVLQVGSASSGAQPGVTGFIEAFMGLGQQPPLCDR